MEGGVERNAIAATKKKGAFCRAMQERDHYKERSLRLTHGLVVANAQFLLLATASAKVCRHFVESFLLNVWKSKPATLPVQTAYAWSPTAGETHPIQPLFFPTAEARPGTPGEGLHKNWRNWAGIPFPMTTGATARVIGPRMASTISAFSVPI